MPRKTKRAATGAHAVGLLKCGACGTLSAPPRALCPQCHLEGLEPHAVPGTGTLTTWTVVRRPPLAFKAEGVYAVAIVKLDAGIEVTGRLASCDHAPALGARVRCARLMGEVPVFEADEATRDPAAP